MKKLVGGKLHTYFVVIFIGYFVFVLPYYTSGSKSIDPAVTCGYLECPDNLLSPISPETEGSLWSDFISQSDFGDFFAVNLPSGQILLGLPAQSRYFDGFFQINTQNGINSSNNSRAPPKA